MCATRVRPRGGPGSARIIQAAQAVTAGCVTSGVAQPCSDWTLDAWRGAGRYLAASLDPAPKFTLSRVGRVAHSSAKSQISHPTAPTRSYGHQTPLPRLAQVLCRRTGLWRLPIELLRPALALTAALSNFGHHGCRYVILRCARREADRDGPGDQEGLSQDGHGPPSRYVSGHCPQRSSMCFASLFHCASTPTNPRFLPQTRTPTTRPPMRNFRP